MTRAIFVLHLLAVTLVFASCSRSGDEDENATTLASKAQTLGRQPLDSAWYYSPQYIEQSGTAADEQTMRARMAVSTESQCAEESSSGRTYDIASLQVQCNSGNARACSDLGQAYLRQGDKASAERYQTIACQAGSALGCNRLAIRLIDRGDTAAAEQLLVWLASNQYLPALANLGGLYIQLGRIQEGINYSWQACQAGSGTGCNHIAVWAEHVGRIDLAAQFATVGCQLSSCAACRTLNHLTQSSTP